MTPAREAYGLPLTLLTVVLVGGIRLTSPMVIAPPTLFSLVLASLLLGAFAQSGVVDASRLVHSERSAWANINGLLVLLTLFLANAQVISRLTPDTGLPALAVSVLFFVTLLQPRLRRWIERTVCVWGVTLLAAFVVKFIVLGACRARRSSTGPGTQALVDGLTFGSLSQPIERPAAGYLAFAMLATYLVGLVLLPATERRRTVGATLRAGQASNLELS